MNGFVVSLWVIVFLGLGVYVGGVGLSKKMFKTVSSITNEKTNFVAI